jgi:hypothetical protein
VADLKFLQSWPPFDRCRCKIDKRNAAMPGAPASTSARVGGWLSDQPYLLLSLTSLFWAGNTVLGRFVVGHIPPMTLAFGRWAGAFLILLPFAAGHLRRDWPVIRKHAGMMTLLAFTGFSAYNTMAYYGLQYTTAINGLLLQSIGPLFVALWTFALSSSATAVSRSCSASRSIRATSGS